jgi:hypothetical protein
MKDLLNLLNKIAADELRPAKQPRKIYNLSRKGAEFMLRKHGGTIREYKANKWVWKQEGK